MFYEVELVPRKRSFYKNFRVSNSKCDVSLRNSILKLDFVTREFGASSISISLNGERSPSKIRTLGFHFFTFHFFTFIFFEIAKKTDLLSFSNRIFSESLDLQYSVSVPEICLLLAIFELFGEIGVGS